MASFQEHHNMKKDNSWKQDTHMEISLYIYRFMYRYTVLHVEQYQLYLVHNLHDGVKIISLLLKESVEENIEVFVFYKWPFK